MVALHGSCLSSHHPHLELELGKCDSHEWKHRGQGGLSIPCPWAQALSAVCRASHNLHVIKAQRKQILSGALSCCRERVHGELGRGCNDENKSVCVNNKGKVMVCWISEALPFKRRVSLG